MWYHSVLNKSNLMPFRSQNEKKIEVELSRATLVSLFLWSEKHLFCYSAIVWFLRNRRILLFKHMRFLSNLADSVAFLCCYFAAFTFILQYIPRIFWTRIVCSCEYLWELKWFWYISRTGEYRVYQSNGEIRSSGANWERSFWFRASREA